MYPVFTRPFIYYIRTCGPAMLPRFLQVAELGFFAPGPCGRLCVYFDETVQFQALWVHHPLQYARGGHTQSVLQSTVNIVLMGTHSLIQGRFLSFSRNFNRHFEFSLHIHAHASTYTRF
jgi:hypothetical protein